MLTPITFVSKDHEVNADFILESVTDEPYLPKETKDYINQQLQNKNVQIHLMKQAKRRLK